MRRLLAEDYSHLGTVLASVTVSRIVKLQNDVGAGLDQPSLPGLENARRQAGRETGEEIAVERRPVAIGVRFRNKKLARFLIAHPFRAAVADIRNHVVYHGPIARPHLGHLHPTVLGEFIRQHDILVFDRTRGGHLKRLGHFQDHVGLADIPSVNERERLRQILRITFRCAGIDPAHERVDVLLRKRPVVAKMPVLRIGEPGRHLFRQHCLLHRFGPWTRLLVGPQRHRRRLARAMAALAVLLQNRRHIFGERHGTGCAGRNHRKTADEH